MLSALILLSLASTHVAAWGPPGKSVIKYTTVTGFFQQDDPATAAESFDYTTSNYGLIDRPYPTDGDHSGHKTTWQRFEHYVDTLNRHAEPSTQYKVLFMGRHGEGFHNAAESYFGTPAWNCYWGPLDGNATVTWRDAALTEAGLEQTVKAFNFWTAQLREEKMPAPESYYSSPLQRCWTTANFTFNGLDLPESRPFVPQIKELLREGISMRTCDERSNKTYIQNKVPFFRFEEGFTQQDELWKGFEGETDEAQLARTKAVLDDIFTSDEKTWLSITSHSGEIGKILETLGHREFSLTTGQAIPVLVKAVTKREGGYETQPQPTTSTFASWTAEATCANGPPVTSVEASGCVCSTTGGTLSFSSSPTASYSSVPAGYPTITGMPSL